MKLEKYFNINLNLYKNILYFEKHYKILLVHSNRFNVKIFIN